MKKKRNIFLMISISIIIVICLILAMNKELRYEIREQIYLKLNMVPIDADTGMINNEFFAINSEGKNAQSTTDGINRAIEYASKNNITYIKLEKGEYLVGTINNSNVARAILLKSNICFDLNGSTLRFVENNKPIYANISIMGMKNVTIKNGILIGDKQNHHYEGNSTHEWGNGIDIRGGQQILIENIQITDMTGDGIFICDYQNQDAKKIEVKNCNISNNRRQAISVTSGKDISIYSNEIHNIQGTWPQSGIDLEADDDEHVIKNVKIYDNIFYDFYSNYAIICSKMVENVAIFQNQIHAKILIMDIKQNCTIYQNNIKNGQIYAVPKEGKAIAQVMIKENELENSTIHLSNVDNIVLSQNKIEEGSIFINASNVACYKNEITNRKQTDFAIKVESNNSNYYQVYLYQNQVYGNYKEKLQIQEDKNIFIDETSNALEEYIQKNFKENVQR